MAARPIVSKRLLRGRLHTFDWISTNGAARPWWETSSRRGGDGLKLNAGIEVERQSVTSTQVFSNSPLRRGGVSFSSFATSSGFSASHFRDNSSLERLGLAAASIVGRPCSPREFLAVRQQHTDEWLVQRALADRKRRRARLNIRPHPRENYGSGGFPADIDAQAQFDTPELSEERIAGVLGRPDLIVTRNIEWANIALGFEQQNRYVIMDPREPQAPVGYILEDSNILMRQLLRTRRPFTAQVLDANGIEICRVRRPIWFINSTIFVEVDGKVVGEAHRRWHLWRRVYDCYLGSKQFAAVENPGFWHWTFTLHDENQGVLAVIDRNWRGFGFEFLTDAGQYVVRFGDSDRYDSPTKLRPRQQVFQEDVMPAVSRTTTPRGMQGNIGAAVDAEPEDQGLIVARPLSMAERAVTLALAVSLDNDYFSNHGGGFGFIPLPFFGSEEAVDSVAPAEADVAEDVETPDEGAGNIFTDIFDGESLD